MWDTVVVGDGERKPRGKVVQYFPLLIACYIIFLYTVRYFFFFCFSPIFLTLDSRRCVNIGSLPARERNLPTIQLFERTVMVDVVFVVTNIDKNILWQVKIDCLEMWTTLLFFSSFGFIVFWSDQLSGSIFSEVCLVAEQIIKNREKMI